MRNRKSLVVFSIPAAIFPDFLYGKDFSARKNDLYDIFTSGGTTLLIIIGIVIAIAIFIYVQNINMRAGSRRKRGPDRGRKDELLNRYVRGEISRKEYEEKKREP